MPLPIGGCVSWRSDARRRLDATHEHGAVVASETKAVAQGALDLGGAGLVGHHIDVHFRVEVLSVDGGRHDLIAQRQNAGRKLHASGRWHNLEVRQLIPSRCRWYLVPATGIQQPGW